MSWSTTRACRRSIATSGRSALTALEFDTLKPEAGRSPGSSRWRRPAIPGSEAPGEMTALAFLKQRQEGGGRPALRRHRRRQPGPETIRSARRPDRGHARRRRKRVACPALAAAGLKQMKCSSNAFVVLTLAALAASGCGIFKKARPRRPCSASASPSLRPSRTSPSIRRRRPCPSPCPSRSRTPNGRRPAATPPSRWVISRSASRSDRPGRSRSAKAEAVSAAARCSAGRRRRARSTRSTRRRPSAPSTRRPARRPGRRSSARRRATARRCSAAASPSTMAASTRPTASAMSRRSTPATAASSGRSTRPARCAAPRRLSATRST